MKLEEFKSDVKGAMSLIENGLTNLKDATKDADRGIENQDDKEEAGLFVMLQAVKLEKLVKDLF